MPIMKEDSHDMTTEYQSIGDKANSLGGMNMLFKIITDVLFVVICLLVVFYCVYMALMNLSDILVDRRKASHKSNLMEE